MNDQDHGSGGSSPDNIEDEHANEQAQVEANSGQPDSEEPSQPAGGPVDISQLPPQAVVEAVLFSTDTPLPVSRIARVTELTPGVINKAIGQLNDRYEQAGNAFRIEEIGGGYQMLTRSDFHEILIRLTRARSDTKLSQAAMETLAIIAYRQPILRADVEAIRGVASGEMIRSLMEKQLVKIVGRAEVIGRPMLYGTTRRFLEVFGLASLEDLPRVEELRGGAEKRPPAASEEAQPPAPGDQPQDQPQRPEQTG